MDTIDGMRTFLAVVQEGSFTAGARRLGMSTALASKYVVRLEERLGVRLLNRTTRSLTLTESGRAYFDRSREVLSDFDDLEEGVKGHGRVPTGNLVVSAPVTFGEMYLTGALSDFLVRNDALSIDLRLSDRFVNLIDEGIDVAIRIGELMDSGLVARRLAMMRAILCASPDYLDKAGQPVHPDELAGMACILDRNSRNPGTLVFKDRGKAVQVAISGRFAVNSAAAVRAMLLAGHGIASVPLFAVADDLRAGRLIHLLPDFPLPEFGIYALYPHNRHLAAKVRVFVDFCVQQFGAEPAWERL